MSLLDGERQVEGSQNNILRPGISIYLNLKIFMRSTNLGNNGLQHTLHSDKKIVPGFRLRSRRFGS